MPTKADLCLCVHPMALLAVAAFLCSCGKEQSAGRTNEGNSKSQAEVAGTPLPGGSRASDGTDGLSLDSGMIGDSRDFEIGRGLRIRVRYVPGGPISTARPADGQADGQIELESHFWLGETEVTQEQWEAVMGTTIRQQSRMGKPYDSIRGSGPDFPMCFVSWEEAVRFVDHLNKKGGLGSGWQWNLPTETQWEHGCRAGSAVEDAGALDALGWYIENSDAEAHPVGRKKPNEFGLCDMHGNVVEWCLDAAPKRVPAGLGSPATSSESEFRAVRGGSWIDNATDCSASKRDRRERTARWGNLGFRVALVPSRL